MICAEGNQMTPPEETRLEPWTAEDEKALEDFRSEEIDIINDKALRAKKTGMLILGGGIVKHHICNANLMRNGADFSVFVNTGQEFDGSDSGAKPDEAISWGKIKMDAKPVKLCCDASLALPLLVSQTFAKDFKPEA